MSNTVFDFSVDSVPDSWRDAEIDAPELDANMPRSRRSVSIPSALDRIDIMTSVIAALATSTVTGVAWYMFETRNVSDSPLLALVAGLVIALAVRLGGGKGDPDVRASIAFIFYMATVLITAYMIERFDYQITYRETPNISQTEYWIVRDRISQPLVVLGWAGGLVLSTQISYITRKRNRPRR